jgi:ecotin
MALKFTKLSIAAWLLLTATGASATDNLQAFPLADDGMVRYVLQLPAQTDEAAYKVELIVGKIVAVDPDNRYFFNGQIEAQTIPGWGFTRYVVNGLGPMAGTLMAIDPDTPKVERFVTLGGEPHLVPYNSRLPIVVYVPQGVEVRYRMWAGAAETRPIEKG